MTKSVIHERSRCGAAGLPRSGALVLAALLVTACGSLAKDQAAEESELAREAVRSAVLARNATWLENDITGHLELYHPDFRRWSLRAPALMTKEGFAGLWNAIKANEEVLSLDVDIEEIVFYADGQVAIAHYTIAESWRWLGDDRQDDDGSVVRQGDIMTGALRFSDVWVHEEGRWLYVGGHRDHMALAE